MPKVHKLIPKTKRTRINKPKPPTAERWLFTRRMAATVLSVSVDTIKGFERTGDLKPIKLGGGDGRLVLFKRADVMALAGLTESDVTPRWQPTDVERCMKA